MSRRAMNKLALLTVIGTFLLLLPLVAGCAPAAAPPAPAPAAPKPAPAAPSAPAPTAEVPPPPGVTKIDIEVLGAGQGGMGWALAHAYAAIINKYGPKWLRAAGVATRGTVDNLISVYKNAKARPYTLMYLSEPMVDAAVLGLKDWGFQEKITTRPLMLTHVGTAVFTVAVLNPKIRNWSDLAGKKIVTDKVGSAKRAYFMDMINVSGFKIEPVNVSLEEAIDLLISGQADGMLAPFQFVGIEKGVPAASAIIELVSQKSAQAFFINIPQDVVQKAAKASNMSSYQFMEMPPKYVYPSIDYTTYGFVDNLTWGVFPEFPEDIAYLVTKLAYEHAEEFASYHAVGAGSSKAAMPWISSAANTHKGALKFYQEKGLSIGLPAKPIEALKAAK